MKRKFKKYSKGQVMVLFAGIIATLLGAIGLCTDVAVMYVNHLQLQKAADAAVVSGAGWLNGTDSTGDSKAITTAGNYAASNGISSSEIVGGAAAVSGDHKTITITLSRTVPYLFGRVIGLINAPIQVTATAGLEAVTGAGGNHLVPFGFVCPSPPCVAPGTKITLPGDTNSNYQIAPGNWGAMDFPDGQNYGGNNYTTAIVNGYQGKTPIMIGTSSGVLQQPGNDMNNHGPAGLQSRYNAGTEVPNTSNPAVLSNINDARVIVIPMVTAFNAGKSTTTPANITGFITALIVPDPLQPGQFYAMVVSTNETMTVASLDGPQTGTTKAVLLR